MNHCHNKKGFTLVELLVSIAIFVVFLGVVSVSYIGIVREQRQANEVRKMYTEVRSFVEDLSQDMRLGSIDYECYAPPSTVSSLSLITYVATLLKPLEAHAAPLAISQPILPTLQLQNISTACPFSYLDTQSVNASQSPYLAIVNKDKTQKTFYWFDQENKQLKVKRYEKQGEGWSEMAGYSYRPDDKSTDQNGSRFVFSDVLQVTNAVFSVNPPADPYSSDNYDKNLYQFQPKVTLSLSVKNADSSSAPFHLDFQTTLSSRVYSRASI